MSMIKTILDRIALVVSKYGCKVIIGYYKFEMLTISYGSHRFVNWVKWNSNKSEWLMLFEL